MLLDHCDLLDIKDADVPEMIGKAMSNKTVIFAYVQTVRANLVPLV